MKSFRLSSLLILFILLSATLSYADTRSDYDNYVATYNAYKAAISEGRSSSEVAKLLEDYTAAKAKYENIVRITPNTQEQESSQTTSSSSTGAGGVFNVGTSTNSASNSATTTPAATTKTSEYSSISIDSELKRLIDDLWSEDGRKSPDFAIRSIESYINKNPYTENADIARYELAKAYELLKDDPTTATKMLEQLAKGKSSIASLSKERLDYIAAGSTYNEWQQTLNKHYSEIKGKYMNFKSVSWLAFPVKITRWLGYSTKMFSFEKAKNEHDTFMIEYEALGAKFAPPVEITFDNFKVAYETKDADLESTVVLRYDNPSSWYTRWQVVNDATDSIDLQYFIMEDDIFGYSLLGLIYKKVLEGVKVRILLDARGTKKLTRKIGSQDILQEIAQFKNVEIKVFNPVMDNMLGMLTDLRKIVASNHDKIIVVDDTYAIIGGRNVSKDYYLDPSDHPGAYRDCDILVKDPAVAKELKKAFDEEFEGLITNQVTENYVNLITQDDKLNAAHDAMSHYLKGNLLSPRTTDTSKYKKFLAEFNKELEVNKKLSGYANFDLYEKSVKAPVKIIDKNSFLGTRNDITEQVIKFIDGAKREVMIQNPYVVLSERMFNALKRADQKGIPIIMHTNSPASTDSLLTQAMFYADWQRIFTEIPGIKIYVYKGSNKLHAKTWVFDRKIGVVGTYNLDYISEQINSEVVAAVKSEEFSKQLRTGILSDIAISAQYKYGVNEDGEFESVGPDDYQGKNFWLLKAASKLDFLKFLI